MQTMTCREFERRMHERLDARDAVALERDEDLARHTALCPRCAAAARRYRVLSRALAAWGPPPGPPPGLTPRILAAHAAARRRWARVPLATIPAPVWWSAAAAVLILALGVLGLRGRPGAGGGGAPIPVVDAPAVRPDPARPHTLNEALAEAAAATLELALETSGPAARVGRGVVATARLAQDDASAGPDAPPGPPGDAQDSVGAAWTRGVRPLSGSARHAFRFLLPTNLGGS